MVLRSTPTALKAAPMVLPFRQIFNTFLYRATTSSGSRLRAISPDYVLEVSALSRPLHLGVLYNAQKDQLIPGNLWKTEDMMSKTCDSPHSNKSFQVAMSESFSEKTSLLDVSDSVKASFLCGLVEVEGSAKYLNNKTTSTHQCQATLRYNVTTELKQLMISELEPPNPELLEKAEKRNATHVVIGVLYGADALMEFHEMASDDSSKKEIHVNLTVMLNKLPSYEINADGSVKMDDEDKKKVKNFKCTFFGDFLLKEPPSTYEEAVKVYKKLPSLLGEKGENAVPVKVWLFPLSKLTGTESKLKRMISETLVSQVEKVMDEFHQAEMRTNDLLKSSKEIKAEDIVHKLETFQSSLRDFTAQFQRKIADLIPAIRGGNMEETALKDLLKSQDASGFSGKEMEQWLDEKETEIKIVTQTIEELNEITNHKIIYPGHDLDILLMNPVSRYNAVFSFTSLNYVEPYLKKISNAVQLPERTDLSTPEQDPREAFPWYLGSLRPKFFKDSLSLLKSNISTPEQDPIEEVPWYKRPNAWENQKLAVQVFGEIDLEQDHKVISYIPHAGVTGATVYGYLQGHQIHSFACKVTLDPSTAHLNLSLTQNDSQVGYSRETQPWDDYPTRFDSWWQVLSKEPLIERCYWIVNWTAKCFIGVAYESMERKGKGYDSVLGGNEKSWCVEQDNGSYSVWYNNSNYTDSISVSNTDSVAVYLDRKAGKLSFYGLNSNTHTLTLLHTFNIKFTNEVLYAGFTLGSEDSFMSVAYIPY
ncbi:stonustoxin subunit beta-like [Clupea harengus]|uniref:Stonustoxin subunit beta-like n=1 Tax=Clupea harengus TaxID=7950 RepID=A0A6P8F3B7_CLUHA|nr:stonustoxin subunit beta-like [Clupea harengus]